MRRVLVVNGNYTDMMLIKAFKRLGLYVITTGLSKTQLSLGDKFADEHIDFDYSDKKGMLELAKTLDLDYVSPNSNDLGVCTAAYIADNLELPGNDTYEHTCIYSEKDKFKEFAMKNGLSVVSSHWFSDKKDALEFVAECKFPIIVKPVDSCGGKGCTRVDDNKDLKTAINYAFENSKSKRIVIEPFIIGTKHSITTFIVNKEVVTYVSSNEFDSVNKDFLVGCDTTPADGFDEMSHILVGDINKIAKVLGLKDGIFHAEYIVKDGKPYIIECMRRCIGNFYLTQAGYATGFCWEDYIAKAYLGMDCSDIPHITKINTIMTHYYIPASKNGVIKSIEFDDSIKKYIVENIILYNKGDRIDNYVKQFIGYTFLRFNSKEERDFITKELGNLIKIEII